MNHTDIRHSILHNDDKYTVITALLGANTWNLRLPL